jgi:signal transduction histidine kinase
VGVPVGHPQMRSLLAVPIVSGGRVIGNLYLAEKQGGAEFSAEDENTLTRFATQAALAIENARLHLRVRDVAIAEERERIAREMHDSLAQVLGYVMTKAQAVQELLKRDQPEKASAQVAQLNAAARDAYADVREGILALRTSVGSERGLLQALREYLERWEEQSGLESELQVRPDGERLEGLSPLAELQLLRIVQEALANVRKHAQAHRVDVCITAAPDSVETVIADDGRGFDPDSPARDGQAPMPHFGLATMRERAESVGGTLRVQSKRDAGTQVIVRLPT